MDKKVGEPVSAIAFIISFLIIILSVSLIITFCWNVGVLWILPSFPKIGFLNALALVLLCTIVEYIIKKIIQYIRFRQLKKAIDTAIKNKIQNNTTTEHNNKMMIEQELRSLMQTYANRKEKIHLEIEEAKRDGDIESQIIAESLHRQMRFVIAELFQTMKKIGILDDEEIQIGCVKNDDTNEFK